ncbi:MAG: type II secretion system F family protein [Paracoccaceae bacterium]
MTAPTGPLAALTADPTLAALALGLLACLCLAGYLTLSAGGRPRPRKLAAVVPAPRHSPRPGNGRRDDHGRRREIDKTLREMNERRQSQAIPNDLRSRLRQAGLGWSRRTYVTVGLCAGAAVFALAMVVSGLGPLPSAAFGAAGGVLIPHLYVARARARRFKAFLAEMPDALDVITRGVRSGLPLGDCLRGIATDAGEPLRSEFRLLADDMSLGLALDDAMIRMARRTPLLEVKLLGIILAIQGKAGGNLSEAIGNLSRVLRQRKQMKGKIKALASEATASAAIIGSLPIIVLTLLYLAAPDYIGLLFSTQPGIIAMIGGGVWMSIGILVMRGMINIDL